MLLLSLMLASATLSAPPRRLPWASVTLPVQTCSVVDGDTIKCLGKLIRFLGIDAPDRTCRRGRVCAPGDWRASKRTLQKMMSDSGFLLIRQVATDRYGRPVAMVSVGGADLSCRQLAAGQAIYVRRWDDGGRVASACPHLIH